MSEYQMRPVRVSAHVAAAPDEVFALIADTRNDPLWCPNVTDAVQTAGDGVELGSRFRFHQTVEAAGRHFESDVDVEVVELNDHSITWAVEDKFQARTVTLTVEPDGEGSEVTQSTLSRFKRKPDRLTRLGYPILAKRVFRAQFRNLEEHLSSTG